MELGTNLEPVAWMYRAMFENDICGDLISVQTLSSGQRDKYHKRGNRDTIIVVPDNVQSAHAINVIYWFHGLTGFKKKTFVNRLGPQYGWLINQRKLPAILVVTEMPWSKFTRTQWKRQGKVFRKKDEFLDYTREVESHIARYLDLLPGLTFSRVVIGHSAGGSAIASAARYGGLCAIDPHGVVFSDSTYGNWFVKSWNGCLRLQTKKKKLRVLVLGQSFGTPWKRFSTWKKKNKEQSVSVEAYRLPLPWTHGRIGNNAIPFFWGAFQNGIYRELYGYKDEK